MKNILVPTDFTIQSLHLIVQTAETMHDEEINIVLFHVFNPPFDITELLFLKREPLYAELITEGFRKECHKLKKRYSSVIGSINFKPLYGTTKSVFRNFAEANNIDLIVWPNEYNLYAGHKYSYNPENLVKSSGVKILSEFSSQHEISTVEFSGYAKRRNTTEVPA